MLRSKLACSLFFRMKKCLLVMIVFALFTAVFAAAESNCIQIRGMGQALYPTPVSLNPGDVWGGLFVLSIGETEILSGVFSGQDGVYGKARGWVGQGRGGSYTFAFNDQKDSFTTYVTMATWPVPPGKNTFGYYQAAQKIVSGTGRFAGAAGNILVAGTAGGPAEWGVWNPEVSGNICLP